MTCKFRSTQKVSHMSQLWYECGLLEWKGTVGVFNWLLHVTDALPWHHNRHQLQASSYCRGPILAKPWNHTGKVVQTVATSNSLANYKINLCNNITNHFFMRVDTMVFSCFVIQPVCKIWHRKWGSNHLNTLYVGFWCVLQTVSGYQLPVRKTLISLLVHGDFFMWNNDGEDFQLQQI